MSDKINPTYYQKGIETTDYIVSHSMNYLEGNIIKYVTRHRQKNGAEDILKAIHYLELILEYDYNESDILQKRLRQERPAPCQRFDCPRQDQEGPIENHD